MLSQLSQQGRYVLTLIGLLAVVASFGVSVYLYTEEGFSSEVVEGQSEPSIIDEVNSIDFVGVFSGKNERPGYVALPDSQIANYNPRTPDTRSIVGTDLILRYFSSLNTGEYSQACGFLSLDQCNARRSIVGFSNFPASLRNGYEDVVVYKVADQEDEEIYCVKYQYQLVQDTNPNPIEEVMQFRIRIRPDNLDEISARVCEAKKKGELLPPCPIVPEKTYCLD